MFVDKGKGARLSVKIDFIFSEGFEPPLNQIQESQVKIAAIANDLHEISNQLCETFGGECEREMIFASIICEGISRKTIKVSFRETVEEGEVIIFVIMDFDFQSTVKALSVSKALEDAESEVSEALANKLRSLNKDHIKKQALLVAGTVMSSLDEMMEIVNPTMADSDHIYTSFFLKMAGETFPVTFERKIERSIMDVSQFDTNIYFNN